MTSRRHSRRSSQRAPEEEPEDHQEEHELEEKAAKPAKEPKEDAANGADEEDFDDDEVLNQVHNPGTDKKKKKFSRLRKADPCPADDEEEEIKKEPMNDDDYQEEESLSESEDDDELLSEEEEEEEDDSDDGYGHRYSRRKRATVDRYTPGRPKRELRRSGRRGSYAEDDLTEHRYSSRNRRTVDRFNPLDYEDGGKSKRRTSGKNERESKRARREVDYRGAPSDLELDDDLEEEDSETELDTEDEDDAVARRRNYSLRERAQPEEEKKKKDEKRTDSGGGGGVDEMQRMRARNLKSKRGSRFMDRDGGPEIDQLPFAASRPATTPGGSSLAPWAFALNAIGLGPGLPFQLGDNTNDTNIQHPNAAIAATGGGKGHGGSQSQNAASLEITPLKVDPSVGFDQVGGLENYVRALKEMVFLPLVYPELFERFQVSPPRGVLFYGPPGTGKTLVARALAAHASKAAGGRKVSFFMRKGADVLSKWVGESERHLRLLFEEARKCQPSIIFFDEIDGLAPVRSSRSDQIHNSIVSTLLALMDGLDPRGQVVVIGATNRVDALDGALRRPGRFDRELLFPLPGQDARQEILKIHTKKWAEPPSENTLEDLAAACVGYCGADLKSLCTEASLAALRRKYPQIYDSEHKLLIDPSQVKVEKRDFLSAFENITPASHRAAASPGRPLPPAVGPALLGHLQASLAQLQRVFPPAAACLRKDAGLKPGGGKFSIGGGFTSLCLQRPRLLIAGPPGCGQAHLGPALLYALEGLQAHSIGLPSLLSDVGARSPEEALVHAIAEARRAAPAVLYLPHLQTWWDTAPGSLRATLWALLADLPPDLPLLLLSSADVAPNELDPEARALFGSPAGEGVYTLSPPTHDQRVKFFENVSTALVAPASLIPPDDDDDGEEKEKNEGRESLPLAPDALEAEEAAKREVQLLAARKKYEEDQATLRALRMVLRWVLEKLLSTRRWESFWEPVDPKEDPKYWEIVEHPMDLSTLLSRVDQHRYSTPAQFLADVSLIPAGEKHYWKDLPQGVKHISRACALEDETRAMVESAVPADLNSKLEALLAAGGPVLSPEGLNKKVGLLEDGTFAQPEGQKKSDGEEEERRTRSRLGGVEVDDRIIHKDPEAQIRQLKELKRKSSIPSSEMMDVDTEKEKENEQEVSDVVAVAPLPASKEKEKEKTEIQLVTPQQKSLVASLQSSLAECTGGLSLESLEEINAQIGRLAWERRAEVEREAVINSALRTANELSQRRSV